MANHFYAYISRMRCVKRWALMRNTEEENIQEHSHMVAVLAHALALIRTRVFGLPTDANAVAVAALYHDATEILTGDMPTPIKYYNPEIRDAYRKVEAVASDKLLSMLPQELRADYEPIIKIEDEKARQGGGQAVGLYQVCRRAQGGQHGIQKGCGADAPRAERDAHARARLFHGQLHGELLHDAR